jgi:hypothetical protein
VAKQRKAAKKAVMKRGSVSKPKPKPKPKAGRAKSGGGEREVHYSDLRKVMLASVLKRLT